MRSGRGSGRDAARSIGKGGGRPAESGRRRRTWPPRAALEATAEPEHPPPRVDGARFLRPHAEPGARREHVRGAVAPREARAAHFDWSHVGRVAFALGRRTAGRYGWDFTTGEDLAQEALARLAARRDQHAVIASPAHWLARTIHNLAEDHRTRRRGPVGPLPGTGLEPPDRADLASSADPADQAEHADLLRVALALVDELPPPCKQIAALQLDHGCSRREIVRLLRVWRPEVPDGTCRWLLATTHVMLRAAVDGVDLRRRWAWWFDEEKNLWSATPSPNQRVYGRDRRSPVPRQTTTADLQGRTD